MTNLHFELKFSCSITISRSWWSREGGGSRSLKTKVKKVNRLKLKRDFHPSRQLSRGFELHKNLVWLAGQFVESCRTRLWLAADNFHILGMAAASVALGFQILAPNELLAFQTLLWKSSHLKLLNSRRMLCKGSCYLGLTIFSLSFLNNKPKRWINAKRSFFIRIGPHSGATSEEMMILKNFWLLRILKNFWLLDFVAPHDALRERAGLHYLSS